MSARVLREAAALMRDRASSALNSGDGEPWYPAEELHDLIGGGSRNTADAVHIATFANPAVALAVADWLEVVAARNEALLSSFAEGSRAGAVTAAENTLGWDNALAVANAYLATPPH